LTTAPTPADVGGFPRKNMRFETLPKKQQFLNSKSNREGRSTHTVIILYKTQQVN